MTRYSFSCLFCCLCCIATSNYAQSVDTTEVNYTATKNDIAVELFGSGVYYLVRYNRSIEISEKLNFRFGPGVSIFPFRIKNLMDYRSVTGAIGVDIEWSPIWQNIMVHGGTDLAYHYLFDSRRPDIFGCCSDLVIFVPKIGFKWDLKNGYFVNLSYTPLIQLDQYEEGDTWEGPSYIHFGSILIGKNF